MEERNFYSNQRRVRANRHIRELAAPVRLHHYDFIQPLFIDEALIQRQPIASLNEINSDTIASALEQIENDLQKGISKFLLFPVPAHKAENNFDFSFFKKAIQTIKEKFGNDVWLAADVCFCAYTSHGHCGILNKQGNKLLNHETVTLLADYSLQLAQSGIDCIAPSDVMDGRIAAIRNKLNENGFDDISIMSYSAKFQSNFYGPFRDACHSSPAAEQKLKDRKTYQLSFANPNDAISTALRDADEGADIIMIKPSVIYSDIIYRLKQLIQQPIAAYHVSGEYQSIELLAQQGLLTRSNGHIEIWTALKRSGADIIISYAARHAKEWIEKIEY